MPIKTPNLQPNSQQTPQTEIVYKRGARSISRKRTSTTQGAGVVGLGSGTKDPILDSSMVVASSGARKSNASGSRAQIGMPLHPELATSQAYGVPGESSIGMGSRPNLHRNMLGASDSKTSLNTEQRREMYRGGCGTCQDGQDDGRDRSKSNSIDQRL